MLKIVIGLAIAAFLAVSPPSRAGQPTCLPLATHMVQPKCKYGLATWYGDEFQGEPTASGETYNMYGLTAAHRYLPLGTRIKVTNLRNHRSLILRINDRGPYVPGRLLDVSRVAAERLGFMGSGKARVRVEVVKRRGYVPYHLACPGAGTLAMN